MRSDKYWESLEKDIELRLASMKDLVLTTVVESAQISSFYMRRPDGRCMSTLLTFTPEGIVLQGDHVPEGPGTCSCPGYGLCWFTEELDVGYLCEKFLEKTFVSEYAVSYLKDRVLDARRERRMNAEVARRAWNEADAVALGDEDSLYDVWSSVFGYGDPPCWNIYPSEAVIGLVAIQRKFSELYYRARTWQPS